VEVDAALGGGALDEDEGVEGVAVAGGVGEEAVGGLLWGEGVVVAAWELDDG